MRVSPSSSPPTILARPVHVELRSKAQCAGDARLEDFRAGAGPAAREVRLILQNLHSGEALPQTVALLSEEDGPLLGIASIRIEGNPQLRPKPSTPWFLRRLSRSPYVNLVARDERFRNHLLCDGETRLGSAIVRSALEIVEHELAARSSEPVRALPTVWALVRRGNEASKRAFGEFGFYPHDRSAENEQDVLVRRAGRRLPPPPPEGAYVSFAPAAGARERSA